MISDKQIAEWRKLRNSGWVSAVGEYTPHEFWEVLDELERLKRLSAAPRRTKPRKKRTASE